MVGDGPLAGSPSVPIIPDLIERRRSNNRRQACAMLEESERQEEREEGITPGDDVCIMELQVFHASGLFGDRFYMGRPARSPP
jgi:hypothetical protein